MKPKDAILLAIALVFFAIAGFVGYGQLAPQSKSAAKNTPQVEVITPISADLDQNALSALNDTDKARDFSVQFDLNSGLGNTQPFGSL